MSTRNQSRSKQKSHKKQMQHLQELNMLDRSFQLINFDSIQLFHRILVARPTKIGEQKTAHRRYIEVLDKQIKNRQIQNLLKQACFIHILFQEMIKSRSFVIKQAQIDYLVDKINGILEKSKQLQISLNDSHNKKKQNQEKNFSVEKTFNWLRDKLSISKQKKPVQKSTLSIKKKISQLETSDSVQRSKRLSVQNTPPKQSKVANQVSPFAVRQHFDENISSKQMLFQKKLFEPYLSYLLKIFSWQRIYKNDEKQQEKESERIQEQYLKRLWRGVNLMRSLNKICEKFSYFSRYFQALYQPILIFLIHVLDRDIHSLYSGISKLVEEIKTKVDCQFLYFNSKELSKQEIELHQKKIMKQLNLEQFKQIIQEISVINEHLAEIYMSKYLYKDIVLTRLKLPFLIRTSGQDYDLIFALTKKKQKQEKRSLSKASKTSQAKSKDNRDSSVKNNQKTCIDLQYHPVSIKHEKKFNPAARQRDKIKITIDQNRQSNRISRFHIEKEIKDSPLTAQKISKFQISHQPGSMKDITEQKTKISKLAEDEHKSEKKSQI